MIFNHAWSMPNKNTFSIPVICEFVNKWVYRQPSLVTVDPFARNCLLAQFRNDLNKDTKAEFHMDSIDFLAMVRDKKIIADTVIFDPPFSPRQIKECYDSVGIKMNKMDAFRTSWKPERDIIDSIVKSGGVVLSFGWNTVGMGSKRGFEIIEILDVCHGPGHNDTLCIAEIKT